MITIGAFRRSRVSRKSPTDRDERRVSGEVGGTPASGANGRSSTDGDDRRESKEVGGTGIRTTVGRAHFVAHALPDSNPSGRSPLTSVRGEVGGTPASGANGRLSTDGDDRRESKEVGGTGIRTQEAVRLPAFKAGAIGRSAIPPRRAVEIPAPSGDRFDPPVDPARTPLGPELNRPNPSDAGSWQVHERPTGNQLKVSF